MPPLVPRKRLKSDSPQPDLERPSKRPTGKNVAPRRNRESVFQTLDTPPTLSRSLSKTKAFLEQDDDDSSELSDLESSDEDGFEDVISNAQGKQKGKQRARDAESSADEEFEDALGAGNTASTNEPIITGDISITFSDLPTQSAFASDGKKGPSKIQRQIRYHAHCMHVQFLMFHNLMRNAWIQDKDVQKTLVENLNIGCWKEMQRFWRDSGIVDGPARVVKGGYPEKIAKQLGNMGEWVATGKQGVKEYSPAKGKKIPKGKKVSKSGSSDAQSKDTPESHRNQRDWGAASDRLEPGTPNLSAGDPLLRLLKYLSSYWKSKFKTTAPCLRKRGYLSPQTLEAEISAWKTDASDPNKFGERIESRDDFRKMAWSCEGSRDVGQQLFTALLRGLGIEARIVASLQPVGFGFSQAEEGKPKNLEKPSDKKSPKSKSTSKLSSPVQLRRNAQAVDGSRVKPINLSDGESSDLSSLDSSGSSIDRAPSKIFAKTRKYGEELPYPTYWTEAISHLTHTPICVSPLPRSTIAPSSNPEALATFYCRGAAADKAKQVFAYIIAFSSDGTAKDVTTRYLPKHQWPGKTKGFRIAPEKVPVYNKRGKVKKWEEWDWFKSVLRPYARGHHQRQPWDEIEDDGDLVPRKPDKPKHMDEEGGRETLQGYKDSEEYVLERHLRREEALKPGAQVVRYFKTGKGDKEKKEPVYYRKDVVSCKTVESWHKEGRAVKEAEQPLKYVPMRAVTVVRKREIEERERLEGSKVKQGLYSKEQTDWIIPDPIQDGRIPRNAFGNIDVYVPTMVPKGAVHIRKKGTARVCKRLGIDFAEACTGFEFGKQRAVPVLTGVVVAAENKDLVIDAWKAAEAEKAAKEQAKQEALVLGLWKKFFVGLRLVERMRKEYGDEAELPAGGNDGTTSAPKKSEWETYQNHGGDFEGGFIRDDAGSPDPPAGGFVRDSDVVMADNPPATQEHYNGALTIDHGDEDHRSGSFTPADSSHRTPISLHAALQNVEKTTADPDGEDSDTDELETEPMVVTKPIRSKKALRLNGRTPKRTPIRKGHISENENDESTLSPPPVSDTEELSRPAVSKPRRNPVTQTPPSRTLPKRKAAIKSDAKVRSHYFAHGSDDDAEV